MGSGPIFWDRVSVRECMSVKVVTLDANAPIDNVRQWIASGQEGTDHQGFPLLGASGSFWERSRDATL